MRRTIVMLVAVAMIMGIFAPVFGLNRVNAAPNDEVIQGNEHATHIIAQWHQVGHDEYGNPLPGGKSFPWQHEGTSLNSYWGREDYGMPNANTAMTRNGTARAVKQNNYSGTVTPMLWTRVYLTVIADDGDSRPIVDDRGEYKGVGLWYVVMDNAGQVWYDPDGYFHDGRYYAPADPFSPYYQYTTDSSGSTFGSCLTNPMAKVDPSEANNTQGPYQFSEKTSDGEENLLYVEPCYFWVRPNLVNKVSSLDTNTTCDAYANHSLTGESRAWQLGILSRPDYYAQGAESPLFGSEYISDGLVRDDEWDIGTAISPFLPNELFADVYGNLNSTPAAPVYDVDDPIYRDIDASGTVTAGDIRLVDLTVDNPPVTFLAGTTVAVGDPDINSFGGATGWSNVLYPMPAGVVYTAAGSTDGTELEFRHLGNPATNGQWSQLTPAGNSFIAVEDASEITAGTAVKIGPNDLGQSQICNVTAVWSAPAAQTRSNNYDASICPYGYHRAWYDRYIQGFNIGDYVYFGSGNGGEMLRITNLYWYGYYRLYSWGGCGGSSSYTSVTFSNAPALNHNQYTYSGSYTYSYGYDIMQRVEQGLLLDCVLGIDCAAGTDVIAIGYQPGDFVYLQQNPGQNTIEAGDIRLSNVDGHRTPNGYMMGKGAWEFDALVMMEVLTADGNDPRYHEASSSQDWKTYSETTDYNLMDADRRDISHPYGHCMPTYDITVESDFWQGERIWTDDPANPGSTISMWKGVVPSVTAVALRSPNDDVDDAAHRVAKQTLLGDKPDDFFLHSATIHNVTPNFREYLGLELFIDSGFDNNPVPNSAALSPTALDLHDNYQRGDVCSPYAGATSRAPDLDLDRDLTRIDGSKDYPKFVDLDNPGAAPDDPGMYGCNEPIYFDLDQDGTVSVGDRRGSDINIRTGAADEGTINGYDASSIVQQGDIDLGRILSRFLDPTPGPTYMEPVYKWYDIPHEISRLPSGELDMGEPIYYDHPELPDFPAGDQMTNPGDVRLSDVDVASARYFCGETMGIGDVFIHEYPLHMISMGRNGDYNYMDFPVLPFPTMDVDIEVDRPLKVEQTSNVKITVNPPPKPGESIFVALRDTRLEARQPTGDVNYYSMKNVEGDWLECDELSNPTYWTASGTYGAGMYRENIRLPFTFNFFGIDFNYIEIGYNGYFNFGRDPYYYTSLWTYSGYYRYTMHALVDPLNMANRPPRIHGLGAWWIAPAEVCYGSAVWPDTGETVYVVTWKGQNYQGRGDLEAQVILFQNGEILIQFQNSACPPSYLHDDMEVGITNGNGSYYEWLEGGPCGFGDEANVLFSPGVIPGTPGRPALDIAEDDRWITEDNPEVNFEFTPYRGTCLQDGRRQPVEINLYRDVGGEDDPAVVPRNPPPKTYLTYREPSYNVDEPYNGRVIAVQNTFGYLPGDWILVGGLRNTERRKITEVHSGSEGAITEMVETNFRSLSKSSKSHILPVKSIDDFYVGNTLVVGWNTSPTQETHIIEHISRDIAYDGGTNPDFHSSHGGYSYNYYPAGENVQITINDASGFIVGDFIGFGYQNNWWTADPPCSSRNLRDVARIIDISGNTITLNRTHTYWYAYPYYYYAHIRGIETRDPIKFQHFDECDAPDGRAEPVITTKFSFSLHRGLNYDHMFGEEVVGIVYFDPFWVDNKWERFDLDMYPTRQFASILAPDSVSPDLDNGYDCYFRSRWNIEPEVIDIVKGRDCISVVDQRFPNVLLTLMDADNPNDVNDPADIPMSCPAGISGADQTIIANVNATGCGVDYLFTAGQSSPNRFIVQVNEDGTYYWWRWYEPLVPTQIFGAYDSNDWLYTWIDDSQTAAKHPNVSIRTPMPTEDNTYDLRLTDNDCSLGGGVCDSCNNGSKWPCMGDVTLFDAYGRFMGSVGDPYSLYPNPAPLPANYGTIENFGVPCVIDRWTLGTDGGQIMFPVKPTKSGDLDVRVYTYQAVFDYNSANLHWPGPYFVPDTSLGIDYCGYTTIKVMEADADANFTEFRMVDHALQNSPVNYTTGTNPIFEMAPPAPRIQASYNPIIYNYNTEVRSYPGGQTHTGRLRGGDTGHLWNAYPAIWENQFVKLGTEYYPLTDYGMYFILANGEGIHIGPGTDNENAPTNERWGRNPSTEPDLALKYMKITGPFMRPKFYREETLNCILGGSDSPYYEYNNVIGLPIAYDYSGEINVNTANFKAYVSEAGGDYSQVGQPLSQDDSKPYSTANGWLSAWRDLYYGGFWSISDSAFPTNPNPLTPDPVTGNYPYVWVFDELIPVAPGNIEIEIELYNGIKKVYQDCCAAGQSGTKDGIPVHGLKIDGAPQFVTVLEDNILDLTVTEDSGKGMINNGEWLNIECNDAVLFAWQDRGVVDPNSNYWYGALDGDITIPPSSSVNTGVEFAFDPIFDRNNDGLVRFNDWETEIVGTYDMATNTWLGGMIDARTYQRENGQYRLELTAENGGLIDEVGIDIGGRDENGRPLLRNHVDHIIDQYETCPFNITAYKYGDDNNDRAFTPLYGGNWSHEVYLAGQVSVPVEPRRDLNVTYSPEPLTAGVIPEKLGDPLTFHITDYNGEPVDFFAIGLPDAHGDAEILERAVHFNLFKDPLPDDQYFYGPEAVMPQYYWLRTDLHNTEDEEGKFNYNASMYNDSFLPIDFTHDSENGNYSFKGFIANDKGEFEVYVYTPDRKHSGVATVKVVSPKVAYEVSNKDEENAIFDVPSTTGDPDFVLTGGDNRIYNVTVTCRNAQDALLKGVAKGVSVCSGQGEDIARFTVANSLPHNYIHGSVTTTDDGTSTSFYHNYAGIDINDDGSLTQLSIDQNEYSEIYYQQFSGLVSGSVYYNTANTQYADGNFETETWLGLHAWWPGHSDYLPFMLERGKSVLTDVQRGWGLGCIYNDKYHGAYLFPDFNGDRILTFRDSFALNEQGRTSFIFYANDACFLTGLVGYNDYCNVEQSADVAGLMPVVTRMDPNYSRFRFNPDDSPFFPLGSTPDGTYQLDWEAWADTELRIGTPDIEIVNPQTDEAWRMNMDEEDVLGYGNYDLTYGVRNHMLVKVYPADRRDVPVHGFVPTDHPSYSEQTRGDSQYNEKAAIIRYFHAEKDKSYGSLGPSYEHAVVGRLEIGKDDPNDREAHIFVDPTGTGAATAGLYMREKMVSSPELDTTHTVNNALAVFNVIKGIALKPEVANALKVGVESTLKVKVVVAGGADEPVAGINVSLDDKDGIVAAATATTNDMGIAEFKVTPLKPGKIIIRAKCDVYGMATAAVGVEVEVIPPMLIIDSLPSTTNASSIKVSGKTSVGAMIKIGADKVKVADDGTFSHDVNLEDGYNSIDVTASNTAGMSTSLTVGITRDSVAPEIILDQEDPNCKVYGPTVVLTGKVEPYSKLTINGKEADVVYDTWRIELTNIDAGELKLNIVAVDPAGNENKIEKTIPVYTRKVMVIQDGHTNVTIDGNAGNQLNRGPRVIGGVFYAPLNVFTQFFGDANPVINAGRAEATIDGKAYVMTVDQKEFTVDGDARSMSNAPVDEMGELFVDVEFFAGILGIETEWDQGSGKMTLTMDIE